MTFLLIFPYNLILKIVILSNVYIFFCQKKIQSECSPLIAFPFSVFYESNYILRQSCISIHPILLLLYILAKNYNSTMVEQMMWNGRHK